MYAARSVFFQSIACEAEKKSLPCRFYVRNLEDFSKTWWGTNEARALWAKSRSESPMSKEVRQANAMTDDHCELWSAVAGDERSARPVGETARRESNKQRSTASLATLGDYCALRNACFPVHKSGKNTFLTD